MLLDWESPPSLSCPAHKRKRLETAIRDRAALAKPKRGRKNHSVNRERARAAKAKNERIVQTLAAQAETRARYLAAARAYWRGEIDEHPPAHPRRRAVRVGRAGPA